MQTLDQVIERAMRRVYSDIDGTNETAAIAIVTEELRVWLEAARVPVTHEALIGTLASGEGMLRMVVPAKTGKIVVLHESMVGLRNG